MLTYFYLVFQAEISGNELFANLGPFTLKIFQGIREHVPDLLEDPKHFPLSFAARKTFLGQRLPPPPQAQKSSYGPALANTKMVFAVTFSFNDKRYHGNQILANF